VHLEIPIVVENESNLRGAKRNPYRLTRIAKAQREAVAWALRAPLRSSGLVNRVGGGALRWEVFELAGPVVVTLTRLAARKYDDDGTAGSMKHVRDEVAACLGLASDRDPRVLWRYGHDRPLVRGDKKVPGVRIEIRVWPEHAA